MQTEFQCNSTNSIFGRALSWGAYANASCKRLLLCCSCYSDIWIVNAIENQNKQQFFYTQAARWCVWKCGPVRSTWEIEQQIFSSIGIRDDKEKTLHYLLECIVSMASHINTKQKPNQNIGHSECVPPTRHFRVKLDCHFEHQYHDVARQYIHSSFTFAYLSIEQTQTSGQQFECVCYILYFQFISAAYGILKVYWCG